MPKTLNTCPLKMHYVSQARAQRWKEDLAHKGRIASRAYVGTNEDTIEKFTVKLGMGYEVDFKLCNGDPTPFIDAVLFHEGNEVCTCEPEFDSLTGDYMFFDSVEDRDYVVRIGVFGEGRAQK